VRLSGIPMFHSIAATPLQTPFIKNVTMGA